MSKKLLQFSKGGHSHTWSKAVCGEEEKKSPTGAEKFYMTVNVWFWSADEPNEWKCVIRFGKNFMCVNKIVQEKLINS